MLYLFFKRLFLYWFIIASFAANFELFHFHSFKNFITNFKEFKNVQKQENFIPAQKCLLEDFIFLIKICPKPTNETLFTSKPKCNNDQINLYPLYQSHYLKLLLRSPPIQLNTLF